MCDFIPAGFRPCRADFPGLVFIASGRRRERHTRFCRTPRGIVRFARRAGQAPANMNKDDIQLRYEYDRWANNRFLQAVSALSDEQFTRDLGGSFRSVRDTLVHIIGGEWGWLTYWKEPTPSSAFVTDLWTRHDALFTPSAFPDVAAVQLKWAEVEREQVEFVNRVTNEFL